MSEPTENTPVVQKPKENQTAGRILFLVAGGVLLAMMVSCACGPVR